MTLDPARLHDPDEVVIERVQRGDKEAFRILVTRYELPVFRLLRILAPRHVAVQDLAQEVFLTAFLKLNSFDATRGRFSSWLLTIAKHQALNARRKRVVLARDELADTATQSTPEDELDRQQIERRLDDTLAGLPDEQRTAFILAEIVGLPAEQIAEIEQSPSPTIRSRISRAKAALLAAISTPKGKP